MINNKTAIIDRKIKIVAWNGSAYEIIEGYEGAKTMTYDANNNLTEITITIILPNGTEKQVKRTFSYDANGNLTNVSRWEVVT